MTLEMDQLGASLTGFLNLTGIGIDVIGVVVILVGIIGALLRMIRPTENRLGGSDVLRGIRVRLGRSLLLGLEILVAADITRTVALGLNFANLGALGLLVGVRTFLSWSLALEIDGRWPWQRKPGAQSQSLE